MNALLALVRKDLVLYFSNRRAMVITLAAPILIAAFFGYVFGGPPKKPAAVPVAVVDQDASAVSKALVAAMKGDTTFALEELGRGRGAHARARRQGARRRRHPPRLRRRRHARALPSRRAQAGGRLLVDPSQSVTLALVKGLLIEHAMKAVSGAAFDPAQGAKLLAQSRADVAQSATHGRGPAARPGGTLRQPRAGAVACSRTRPAARAAACPCPSPSARAT